jgi:cobalt-zinc-cadmium efflux system membrane fusion protein
MKSLFILRPATVIALGLWTLVLSGCGSDEHAKSQTSVQNASTQERGHQEEHAHGREKPGEHASEPAHGEELKLTAEEINAAGIKTKEIKEEEVSEELTLTATIRPNQERITHIAPRVPGRVVKVNASLGDSVKPGQTLAVLDSLEVGEAHSAYLQARTANALAKADFERAEKLHGEQVIARKDYVRAHSEFEKSNAALAAAADKLRMLGVNPAPAANGKAVSTFPLSTPFTGTVIEKHAILGELAQPDKQLFTVADLSRLWIEANLFEKDLGRVKVGADATVTVAAYPEQVFKGKLTYIAAVMDRETRTVPARVEVANPDGLLKPEMFATASIRTGSGSRGLLLPEDAVVLMQGQPTAFVEEHGAFEPRVVELGEKLRGQVVIRKGLEAGEKVVTGGTYALKARIMKSQLGEGHAH